MRYLTPLRTPDPPVDLKDTLITDNTTILDLKYDHKRYPRDGYRIYRIPKSSPGEYRIVEEPNPVLKVIQKMILRLLYRFRPALGKYAHGFMKKRSIVTNADVHIRKLGNSVEGPRCMLKMDLKDFFPSVTLTMVHEMMHRWRYPGYLLPLVASFCFIKDRNKNTLRLPQGAPTSPYLANLAAVGLDYRMAGLANKWHISKRFQSIRYSRYADDLVFTSNYSSLFKIIPVVNLLVESCRFSINKKKTKFRSKPSRLKVCGVVINDKLSTERSLRKNLRAAIHGATTDVLSGITDPGFCLDHASRKNIRNTAGISGSAGIRYLKDMDVPQFVTGVAEVIPIPFKVWEGMISHISSINPEQGKSLSRQLNSLKELSCRPSPIKSL
jgi:retron-type reverse transcriptase